MAALLASWGPRIFIPGFYLKDKIVATEKYSTISQIVAFALLFSTAVVAFFQGHFLLSLIPAIAAVAYQFMMKDPEHIQLYRYTDWLFTTPLMLVALLHTLKSKFIPQLVFADIAMIATGYQAVQSKSLHSKLLWFIVSILFFLPIVYTLVVSKGHFYARALTLVVWSLYPIVWGLENSKRIDDDTSIVCYSIMDTIAKCGLVSLLSV